MKVVCSDLLLPHLIGKLPITSPPGDGRLHCDMTHYTQAVAERVYVQVAEEKAVREVNKHTGSSD